MFRQIVLMATACGALAADPAVDRTEPVKPSPARADAPAVKAGDAGKGTREMKGPRNEGYDVVGVVEAIEAGALVVVGQANSRADEKEYRYTLHPVDVLAAGKVLPGVSGSEAYRWADVQAGDTVRVGVIDDCHERRRYAYAVCIFRRPGGKLPPSQDMKDHPRFPELDLLNDIANGLDVSEDDVLRAIPPIWHVVRGQPPLLRRPGGLSEEWRTRLAENRARIAAAKEKADAGLKAAPPTPGEKK